MVMKGIRLFLHPLLFFTPLHLTIFIEAFILSPLTTGTILFPGQNSA